MVPVNRGDAPSGRSSVVSVLHCAVVSGRQLFAVRPFAVWIVKDGVAVLVQRKFATEAIQVVWQHLNIKRKDWQHLSHGR